VWYGAPVRLVTSARAKVNLVLRVGPRRPDGFHEIDSLMAPLDLADRVEVRVSRRAGPVSCRVPGRPDLDGPSNLAARAADAFRRRFGVARAIAIRIEKRIPVVAGLGGGSSDAAAVLRCLSRAFGARDRAVLSAIGLQIGSDVPFFLGAGPAWASGRGEALTPASVPRLDLVLLYPRDQALAIRAGEAYAWLDAARRGAPPTPWPIRRRSFALSQTGNDLEPPCVAARTELRALLGLLTGHGAARAMMSGSGPTVLGLFRSRRAAREAARAIRQEVVAEALEVLVARTTQGHPRVAPWRSPRSASSP